MALIIRKMTRADVGALVRLHAAVFPAYDSTALGASYLRALYLTLATHRATLSVVAADDGELVAWVGGVLAYGPYYRALLRRCWVRAPFLLWAALVRKPSLLGRGIRFLGWYASIPFRRRPRTAPGAVPGAPRWANLLVIGVAPGCQRRGVGQEIMSAFHAALKEAGFDEVRLSTFVDNDSGNAAFRKAGYELKGVEGRVNRYAKTL